MRRETWVLLLCVVGMLLAGYAVSLHYKDGGDSICNITESFNCDKVNKSPWSKLFGIPVAILGFLANAVLFLLVLKRKEIQKMLSFSKKDVWQYILLVVCVMFGFQIYLTLVEVFFIHAYCLVCLSNQLVLVAQTFFVCTLWRNA